MNHLALFNGIGGFQLAAHWCGWRNVAHVEINPFCNKVVNQHFPDSVCHTDIFEFDGTAYSNTIDFISGGFPCQPFSVAGKRKSTNDKRFLWPQMLRVIREVKPPYVVCENVPGLLTVDNGRTFKRILFDLESAGYTVESFIIPASSVGAWHKRDRLWIICYTHGHGCLTIERAGFDAKPVDQFSKGSKKPGKLLEQVNPEVLEMYRKALGQLNTMLPTPTTQDAKNNGSQSQMNRDTLPLTALIGGKLNPDWLEWLMGFPIGWSELKH